MSSQFQYETDRCYRCYFNDNNNEEQHYKRNEMMKKAFIKKLNETIDKHIHNQNLRKTFTSIKLRSGKVFRTRYKPTTTKVCPVITYDIIDDINAKDINGNTELINAVIQKDLLKVTYLLKRYYYTINVNIKNKLNRTAMDYCYILNDYNHPVLACEWSLFYSMYDMIQRHSDRNGDMYFFLIHNWDYFDMYDRLRKNNK